MSQVWHRRKSPGPDSDVRSSRSQSLGAERSGVFTEPCPMWPRPWERLENLLGGGGVVSPAGFPSAAPGELPQHAPPGQSTSWGAGGTAEVSESVCFP